MPFPPLEGVWPHHGIICSSFHLVSLLKLFAVGVSLNIPVPFYPNEALDKGVSFTQSGNQIVQHQQDSVTTEIIAAEIEF